MKVILMSIISIYILCGSCSDPTINIKMNQKYCYNSETQNLKIFFKENEDTLFFYYINVLDSGKYINAYWDETEYAGYFLLTNVHNNRVSFKIKNYRMPEYHYALNLIFRADDEIVWEIKDRSVSYLPERANLFLCK